MLCSGTFVFEMILYFFGPGKSTIVKENPEETEEKGQLLPLHFQKISTICDFLKIFRLLSEIENFLPIFLKNIRQETSLFSYVSNPIIFEKNSPIIKNPKFWRKKACFFAVINWECVNECLKIWPTTGFDPATPSFPTEVTADKFIIQNIYNLADLNSARHGQNQEKEKNSDY